MLLFGVKLEYNFTEDWKVKGFSGLQKQQFDLYNSVISGASIEGFFTNKEEANYQLEYGSRFRSGASYS
jgi:hypothetical protein